MEEDVTNVTTLNLSKVCRVCLNESEIMHSIFSGIKNECSFEGDLPFIYEILMNISSIKILAEDGLPTMICSECMDLALVSYKFQQQCNRSQIILEAYLTHNLPDLTEIIDASHDSIKNEIQEDSPFLYESDKFESNSFGSETEKFAEKDKLDTNIENTDSSESDEPSQSLRLETCNLFELEHSGIKEDDDVMLNDTKEPEDCNKKTSKDEKVYECNLCEKSYKYNSSLKIHLRTHTLERPYSCKICGKTFKQYGSLVYHHRSHTGEQPYSCKICGKKYKQSGTLTAHMRIHTGQRPFLCSVCGRGFRQAPDLSYHMRTHTKEKPYMCNICGKTMSMQCHLVQHMRTHTGERPFKCPDCSKAFPSSTRLKRHAIIHTGLKPFKCEVCDKSFNRKSSLMVHSKIHTHERPHTCPICGRGFIQAHALRGHVLTHSSEHATN